MDTPVDVACAQVIVDGNVHLWRSPRIVLRMPPAAKIVPPTALAQKHQLDETSGHSQQRTAVLQQSPAR